MPLALQSTWSWSMETSGYVVGDVAYDLFTSWSPGGKPVNEIMIWLSNINSGPISYNYDQWGHAVPIVSNLSIAGQTWYSFSSR